MALADYSTFNRRHFLKHLAGMSALALPGFQFIQGLRAAATTLKKDNKSLIIMWMGGGPPTIDIWDLKPGAPTGGEFKTGKSPVPGVEICEYMPETAKQMKNLVVVRSLVTNEGDHNRGRVLMHTSHPPSPIVNYPSIGSVANHQLTPKELDLPGFISVGAADGPGFLGMNYAPFTVQNPGQPPANIKAPDSLGSEVEQMERIRRRQRLFFAVEDNFREGLNPQATDKKEKDKLETAAKNHEDIYGKAFSLVASPRGKVFDLNGEPKSVRDAYGNNGFGNGLLLARRLVEAGVTAVEVNLGGWDLHTNTQATLKTKLPPMDKSIGTLVDDLVKRGLWKNTVVMWMGEFGRTPRINQNAGRDHWARCWSVLIGGGAIKGGQSYGSTDADGTSVKDNPVTIGDLFATIYKGMGMDPALQIRDNLGRPMPIADGKPISALV